MLQCDLLVLVFSVREIHRLNWGVLAHLMHHGYKVTAMTMQEEAQGQIESPDVGGENLPLSLFTSCAFLDKDVSLDE